MGHGVIVGIAGPAGSGKDTVAFYLRNSLLKQIPPTVVQKGSGEPRTYLVVIRSLATPMKRFCRTVFGWDFNRTFGPSQNRSIPDPDGLTPRRALQTLGTEWGRALREDVWVDYLFRSRAEKECTIVSDVRFPNEAQRIREEGGIIVHVLGRNEDGDKSHESEAHVGTDSLMVEGDVSVFNTGTLKELDKTIRERVLPRILAKLEGA